MSKRTKNSIRNFVNLMLVIALFLSTTTSMVTAADSPPGDTKVGDVPNSAPRQINVGENGNGYTTEDNAGPDGQPPADGDMDDYLYNDDYNVPIEFNIWLDSISDLNNPTLNLYAYDIDETSGERDEVYLNGHFIGTLTGADDQWSTTVLPIIPVFLQQGNNLIQIQVDVLNAYRYWAVQVDWGQIFTSNQTGPAFIRSIELDKSSYFPGEIVNANVEVDTTLALQDVIVETNLVDPDGIVLDGSSQIITLNENLDDPYSWNLNLPSDAAGGYYVQVLVFDLASSLLQATGLKVLAVSTKIPIILIPGIMGSRLFNFENGVEQEIWVDPLKLVSSMDVLMMASNGSDPAKDEPAYNSVHVKDGVAGVLTRIESLGNIEKNDFYYSFFNHFTENLNYKFGQDVWAFPYDWRKDLTTSALELGKLVEEVRSQTGASQVYLIAHSMGGLVAREYISDPSQAIKIRRAVILGTPFLGTPKAYEFLRAGMCIIKLPVLGCTLKAPMVKAMVSNFPAFNQIMPSRTYFDLKGGGFYINSDSQSPIGLCPNCLSFDETYTPGKVPLINSNLWENAITFHSEIDEQTSWNNVPVTLIGGINQSTIIGIREHSRFNFQGLKIGTVIEPVFSPAGDSTVTLLSSSLYGRDTGRSLAGGAYFRAFGSDHGDLVKDPKVLAYIDTVLGLTSSPTSMMAQSRILTIEPELDSAQIVAYGVASIDVVDTSGNHTGPSPYNTDESEEEIPGSAYYHTDMVTTVALIEGQTYTITITPKGNELVDIRLVRSTFDKILSQSLYLGVDVQKESRIVLVGDPLVENGWKVDVYGTGEEIIDLTPTTELGEEPPTDTTPPTVTIQLEGTLGPDGWYTSPVTVTLLGVDDEGGAGLSRIEYAFSNDRTVRLYSGPFVVSPEAVGIIYALGVDLVGNAQVEAASARIGPEKIFLPIMTR